MSLHVVTKDELHQHKTWTRPYARIRGSEPSVTTLLGQMDKPGLAWGAAKETALYAVFHEDWRTMAPAEAVDKLYKRHRGVWDGKAAMGTLCHAGLQAWCAGETIDLARLVAEFSEQKARIWQGDEERVISQANGYIDGLAVFFDAHNPEPVSTEEVVRTPGLYIGQTDLLANIDWPACPNHPDLSAGRFFTRLDLKTSSEADPAKAIYTEEWVSQVVAYDRAQEIVHYRDELGKPVECCTEPNVRAERHAIIHLRGDGHFDLIPLYVDDAAYERFLGLVAHYQWKKKLTPARPVVKGEA